MSGRRCGVDVLLSSPVLCGHYKSQRMVSKMEQVEFQKCRGNGYANGVACAIIRRVLDTKRKNAMNVLKFAKGTRT